MGTGITAVFVDWAKAAPETKRTAKKRDKRGMSISPFIEFFYRAEK
jgi:hypothetical protein